MHMYKFLICCRKRITTSDPPCRRDRILQFDYLQLEVASGASVSPYSEPGFDIAACQTGWLHSTDFGVAADFMGGLMNYLVQRKLSGSKCAGLCQEMQDL